MFLKKIRGQQFQNENNLNALKMLGQELVTIQTTGDHLSDAMITKTLVNFLQSDQGRFRIA